MKCIRKKSNLILNLILFFPNKKLNKTDPKFIRSLQSFANFKRIFYFSVIATVKEPVSGWIDNYYGATGVLLGAAIGLLRTLHAKKTNVSDMVPADYVINGCLAATWDVATIKCVSLFFW